MSRQGSSNMRMLQMRSRQVSDYAIVMWMESQPCTPWGDEFVLSPLFMQYLQQKKNRYLNHGVLVVKLQTEFFSQTGNYQSFLLVSV